MRALQLYTAKPVSPPRGYKLRWGGLSALNSLELSVEKLSLKNKSPTSVGFFCLLKLKTWPPKTSDFRYNGSMPKKLLKWLPLGILCFISLALFVTNYVPGHYLLGWDNTVPELNLGLNLQRFVFGIWQEYRGLGTLDGMAHTANLSYLLFVRILAFAMPIHMVRYVSNLLLHLLGGIGIYFLLLNDLLPDVLTSQKKSLSQFRGRLIAISLMGATLYMLNLMTIQMFVTPLELFSVHFAALPWGILALRRYFKQPSAANLWWIFLINFLGSAQAHVPTIFIPYAVTMAVFLFWSWVQQPKKNFKVAFAAGFVLFCAHAFWGVPYVYSTIYKSAEISNSKQNRLGTDGTFYRNLAWGNVGGVMSFGGFQLDYRDWSIPDQQFESIMKDWVELYKQPWYQLIAISLSVCSVLGVFVSVGIMIFYRKWKLLPYLLVWLFAISMLGTDIPILKGVSATLRDASPLFYQIFRFTFTKFSILYVCFLSLMFGVFWTVLLCRTQFATFWKILAGAVVTFYTFAIIAISYPAFAGNFFYSALKVNLPESYTDLFAYLDKNLQTSRLVTFPIHSLWGWTTGINNWGHRGSGFIWQAVTQPLVDRSFDPWSKYNETMYLQMSRALYSRDYPALAKTFEKYQASVIFYDKSIFHPGGYEENIFAKEINDFLSMSQFSTLIKKFGDVELYGLNTHNKTLELSTPKKVSLLSTDYSSTYTGRDQAYLDLGDYIQSDKPEVLYPFSSLQNDELHNVEYLHNDQLEFPIQPVQGKTLHFPKYKELQQVINAALVGEKSSDNSPIISLYFNLPSIKVNQDVIYQNKAVIQLHNDQSSSSKVVLFNDSLIDVNDEKKRHALLTLPTRGSLNLKLFKNISELSLQKEQIPSSYGCDQSTGNKTSLCRDLTWESPTLDPTSTSLLTIKGEVENHGEEVPKICIYSVQEPQNCLNTVSSNELADANNMIVIKTHFLMVKDGKYRIKLQSYETTRTEPWKGIQINVYKQMDSVQASVDQTLSDFQQQLDKVSTTQVQNQKVIFAFSAPYFGIDLLDVTKPRSSGIKNCKDPAVGAVEKNQNQHDPEYKISGKAIGCETFFIPEIDQRQQYIYRIKGKVMSGVGSRIYLLNPFTKHFDIDTTTRTNDFDLTIPIYPSFTIYNLTHDVFELVLNMETFSREVDQTTLTDSIFYPLPLNWLTSIRQEGTVNGQSFDSQIHSYQKLGTTFYLAKVSVSSEKGLIILPQSYDRGWIALSLSRIGEKNSHVVYNGWANGWFIPKGDDQLLIIYWPILLVFSGFILFISCGIFLFLRVIQSRGNIQKYSDKKLEHKVKLKRVFTGNLDSK